MALLFALAIWFSDRYQYSYSIVLMSLARFSFVMQDADYQLFTESVEDELRFGNSKVTDLEQKIDLKEYNERHPLSLSGGQKQRVTIAVAAVSAAPLIIFDEPTSGLDGKHMRKVGAMLRSLTDKGKTILVISHDTKFLLDTCDGVLSIQSS